MGKGFLGIAAYLPQVIGLHDDGVARREEQGADPVPERFRGPADVLLDLLDRPDAELGAVLVHHAERALVPWAAYRGLDEKTGCLAGRAVNWAFVAETVYLHANHPRMA